MEEETEPGKCDSCGEVFELDNLISKPDGNIYCESCLEESASCDDCGYWSINGANDFEWIGDSCYCNDCHYHCDECGEPLVEDDIYCPEDEDGTYCEDCYNNLDSKIEPFQRTVNGNWYFKTKEGNEWGPYGTKTEITSRSII